VTGAAGVRPSIQGSRVQVGDVAMFYRRSVSALSYSGRPMVLVHGLGLCGCYMLPVAERLARHVPVYLPDLPGFGDSAKPDRALDMPALADALAGWIEAMALAPPGPAYISTSAPTNGVPAM
jgi:2-hydroxy-6-oxonona-2,4-dienedioate hydrolase